MIYIIMSTILVIAIIFLLLGSVTVTEETKNNNEKGTDTGGAESDSETVSGPAQVEATTNIEQPKPVSKPRKPTKSRSVQPSTKRTSTKDKRKVSNKGLTINSAPRLNGIVVVKKKTIKK
jgi:hypothetical protein